MKATSLRLKTDRKEHDGKQRDVDDDERIIFVKRK